MAIGRDGYGGVADRISTAVGSVPAIAALIALLHLGFLVLRPDPRPAELLAFESVVVFVAALREVLDPVGDDRRRRSMLGVAVAVALAVGGTWLLIEVLSTLAATVGLVATASLLVYGLHRYSRFVHGLLEGADER